MGYAFISYSSKMQQMADSFKALFNQNGIETWMAPGDIPYGSTYTFTINSAIKKASCFVLLLSESAQGSKWVIKETERAVDTGKTIFPVLLDDVPMNDGFELMLSSTQAVAIRKIDAEDVTIQRLLRAVKACTTEGSTEESPKESPKESPRESAQEPAYDVCKIYLPLDDGTIGFASSAVKSFDDEHYLDFSGELKRNFTAQLEELLSYIYQIDKDMVSIDYISAGDKVRLVPSSERWSAWSVDEEFKIRFHVRRFEHDGELLYDAMHFELSDDLDLTFFKGSHFMRKDPDQKGPDQVIPFEMLGIPQEEFIKSATKLINLCFPKRRVKVQNRFVPKYYSDGSGSYHLKFLLD